jgi:RNA polymerase sigma-70 factor (ECF subfamily)
VHIVHTDWELVQRAAGGDEGAWRLIYEANCDRLFALLCYQVGHRDEASDLLQETFVQAFKSIGGYRGEAPLSSWLGTIALRKALDWKRGALQRFKKSVELDESCAAVEPNHSGLGFASEGASLRSALARLTPPQRAALLLREWEERSFAEIAAVLRCKESTARVHHLKARERMRALLAPEDASPREERTAPIIDRRQEGQL